MKLPSVTDTALKYFISTIKQNGAYGILFSVQSAGCSGLKYDISFVEALPIHAIELPCQGAHLFIEERSLQYFTETTIDLKMESLGQSKVVFLNPLAQNACGCGESFNLGQGESE